MNHRPKVFFLIISMVLLMSSITYAAQDANFGMGKAVLKLLFYTLVMVFVLIVTIYGTRFIAKNSRRFAKSKYMQIIDILNLGANTKIIMIEVNNIVYIIAITNNIIETIDKFPKEEFKYDVNPNFEEQLSKYKNKHIHDNGYMDKIQIGINKMLKKSNKFIDKEDEDDEKKC